MARSRSTPSVCLLAVLQAHRVNEPELRLRKIHVRLLVADHGFQQVKAGKVPHRPGMDNGLAQIGAGPLSNPEVTDTGRRPHTLLIRLHQRPARTSPPRPASSSAWFSMARTSWGSSMATA